MPLLIITGYPSCGKTTICKRVAEYFKERNFGEPVHIIDDEINPNFSRSIYKDFKKEKELRSELRAMVQRLLDRKALVIYDSLNHIKGYRYELFTLAKNIGTRYAVLYCKAVPITCKWLNAQNEENKRYSEEILSNLVGRYELPDSKNRWDAPLIEVQIGTEDKPATNSFHIDNFESEIRRTDLTTINIEDYSADENSLPRRVKLPLDQLYSSLIEGKELTANRCMKSQTPFAPASYLTELDSQTQAIVDRLVALQRTAMPGDKLLVLTGDRAAANLLKFSRLRSLPQLTRIRQQFITYMKIHPVDKCDNIGSLFVDFLNSNS